MKDQNAGDHILAATLATEAGRLLLDVRVEFADSPADERKAAGDKRSHDFLMEQLASTRPDDAVLSEEGADDPIRLSSDRVWIVDPLTFRVVDPLALIAVVVEVQTGGRLPPLVPSGQIERDTAPTCHLVPTVLEIHRRRAHRYSPHTLAAELSAQPSAHTSQ